jgi:hypothetical protein
VAGDMAFTALCLAPEIMPSKKKEYKNIFLNEKK